MKDPAGTSVSTIGELARRCDTSETTVLRLCRTIGFKGYPEFRLALAVAAAASGVSEDVSGEILPGDSTEQVVRKVAGADAQAISDTAKQVSLEALEQAARAIGKARRIDVFGAGASAFVAQDLQLKLHRIGLTAHSFTDPQSAIGSAALLGPDDVAIGLSHTGATADTIRYLQVARAAKATTIAVTNHPRAGVAREADIVLATAATETTYRSGPTASRIAQLTLTDVLFVLVARQDVDKTNAARRRT
jgi:DNA-binding MurR/RpiR family transcriptional regulator